MRISKILFTNTPMEELEEEPSSIFDSIEDPQICHICSSNFSLLNTKYPCSICRLPVCLKDSSFFSSKSRICDQCEHEVLVEEIWKEKKAFKDQIIQNIQETLKENQEKTKLTEIQVLKNEKLRQEILEFQKKSDEDIEKLKKNADELEKINDQVEKNLEFVQADAQSRVNYEALMVEKLAKSQEHLRMIKIDVDEVLLENRSIEKQIKEASEPITDEELSMIYNEICVFCKQQVKEGENFEVTGKVCTCLSF